MKPSLTIGVVGPCAAGKTTLIAGLKARGYTARHIAQEHSYVPAMWRRLARPDLLIFLDVSYELSVQRRSLNWTVDEYNEQQRRLQHARQHTDLYLCTDDLTPQQVLERVLDFLNDAKMNAGY
jgi:deoxyadenosine/deoxycytidine kinase